MDRIVESIGGREVVFGVRLTENEFEAVRGILSCPLPLWQAVKRQPKEKIVRRSAGYAGDFLTTWFSLPCGCYVEAAWREVGRRAARIEFSWITVKAPLRQEGYDLHHVNQILA